MKKEYPEYLNGQISVIIDEYIHNERNRRILKRRFVDGITYRQIAEEFDMSVRHIKTIVYKNEWRLFRYLDVRNIN